MSQKKLSLKSKNVPPHKVLLIIMDGVGIAKGDASAGNAVAAAKIPNIQRLWKESPTISILAHGKAVGMPSDDDMGNSEVGHNALGAGRIFDQGAKLVSNSIQDKSIFSTQTWKELIANVQSNKSTFHFLGLVSDGNVHSNIAHLYAMLEQVISSGVKKIRIHALLDGRDVPEKSALEYITPLENKLEEYRKNGIDVEIASGGGRMKITMDRYNADWSMVELGYAIHVLGKGRFFPSASSAIEAFRKEDTAVIDQYLPPFVVSKDGSNPIGKIQDGDSVVLFNFRGDRAIEISRALTEEKFSEFDRVFFPKIQFAGMMEYDGDLHVPPKYLVSPPNIENTMGEYLAQNKIPQFAISETQKFGHVTYFWNGNRSGYFDESFEKYQEIPSDTIEFDKKPAMKCREITDALVQAIESDKYQFYRVNFANGDMVGHTGNFQATISSLEAMDECIGKLVQVCDEKNLVLLLTADHGNSDEMYMLDKKGNPEKNSNGNPVPKTSHTLNPVPFSVYVPKSQRDSFPFQWKTNLPNPGLANVAATILNLMGFEAPEDYCESLVSQK